MTGDRWVGSRLLGVLFDIDTARLAGEPSPSEAWQVLAIEPSEAPEALRELVAPTTDGEVQVRLDLQGTDNW